MGKRNSLPVHAVIDPYVHRFDLRDVVAFEHSKLSYGGPTREPYRLVFIFGDSRPKLEVYLYEGMIEYIVGVWEHYRETGKFSPSYTTQISFASVDQPF